MIDRLENWGNHYRNRSALETCGSIEKRYQSNWRQWIPASEVPIPVVIDWRDAELVEQAWRGLMFRHKMILKWFYITRRDPRSICVRLRIGISRYDREFAAAHAAIKKILKAIDNENSLLYKETSIADLRFSSPLTSDAPLGRLSLEVEAA